MRLAPFFRSLFAHAGLRIAVPAILVLVATIATVAYSLDRMASEANQIENALTARSAKAAIMSFVRSLGDSHGDYAAWDDAVRALYGKLDEDFISQNYQASTESATFFNAVYLLDENGAELFGYRDGDIADLTAQDAYGPVLRQMLGRLPLHATTYAVQTGLLQTKWGLAAVAAGPVVPNTENFGELPERARYLVISKDLDDAALTRLGENYVIEGVRFSHSPSPTSIALTDPTNTVLGYLTWLPRRLGTQAGARVGPMAGVSLGLLSLTFCGLIFIAIRGLLEVHRREIAARFAATHDSLTGLPNRAGFMGRVEAALTKSERSGVPCVLLYVDLDNFKEVNDAYGHGSGDELLRQVAQRLRNISDGHLLSRLGGDEFAALLTGGGARDAAQDLSREIVNVLREPLEVDGRMLRVGASIGIARAEESDLTAQELLRRADVAMYEAKQKGANRYFVYDALVDKLRHERIAMTNELRAAVAGKELSLAYQPVVAAGSLKTVAVEALLRWRHPQRGNVPPSVFIPIAEEAGLMSEIGTWALERACAEARDWHDVRLAVNVSPAQLRTAGFDAVVARALAVTGFPARRLEIEVTETYFLSEPEQAVTSVAALRRLGMTVSLDDFGTGYSSIGYLRRFRFDKLKLDRSMIVNIVTEPSVQRLVHATVTLANALGLRICAEGIESREEAVLLQAAGCNELQGFLFGKPMTADEMTVHLSGIPEAERALSA